MPHQVTLRGPKYTFTCYGEQEAKDAGLIDSKDHKGQYEQKSVAFGHGEGRLLEEWLADKPNAILIAGSVGDRRYQITVYTPRP